MIYNGYYYWSNIITVWNEEGDRKTEGYKVWKVGILMNMWVRAQKLVIAFMLRFFVVAILFKPNFLWSYILISAQSCHLDSASWDSTVGPRLQKHRMDTPFPFHWHLFFFLLYDLFLIRIMNMLPYFSSRC